MQKMLLEYAQKLLDGGYAFGNSYLSHTDSMLVVETKEDWYPYRTTYSGAELENGKLKVDEKGYVVFTQVEPIIDENTKFRFA